MNLSAFRTIIVVIAIVVLALPASASAIPRVIGGEKVSDAEFQARYSSVVSVQASVAGLGVRGAKLPDSVTHVCGGTLIAPRLVLTAAHCVTQGGFSFGGVGYEVLAGTERFGDDRTTVGRVPVQEVFVHPAYVQSYGWGYGSSFGFFEGQSRGGFDVAVLRLERAITGVTPTPLVTAAEDGSVWGGGNGRLAGAVALGWGATKAPGYGRIRASLDLQAVELPIRSDRRCERSDGGLGLESPDFERATMLCAGVADGPADGNVAKSVCYGDSGGPLFAPAADGSLRVVGVSSWTTGRDPCRRWSGFSRIAGLRDWIVSIREDGGGASGLTAPGDVRAVPVGNNRLRVRWSPSSSGTATRYHVHREFGGGAISELFGFPRAGIALVPAATTDAIDTSIIVGDIAPRRPGVTATRPIRVDAQDADGNRVQGEIVRVTAPVDGTSPSAPSMPTFVAGRRYSAPSVRFRGSFDADCIARYDVQVSNDQRGWRTNASQATFDCERTLFGIPERDADERIGASVIRLGPLTAGTWRMRIVAFDRAGNRTASRSTVFHLDETIRRRRSGSYSSRAGVVIL